MSSSENSNKYQDHHFILKLKCLCRTITVQYDTIQYDTIRYDNLFIVCGSFKFSPTLNWQLTSTSIYTTFHHLEIFEIFEMNETDGNCEFNY